MTSVVPKPKIERTILRIEQQLAAARVELSRAEPRPNRLSLIRVRITDLAMDLDRTEAR